MPELRNYQQRALDMLYAWFEKNDTGNPCLVMPTGSGKSHIIAALCRDALKRWPKTRILMLTHVKELIEQNAAKLRGHWPNAPLGIYSAGLRQRNVAPITFAGIQSVRNKASILGHQDLVVVDEAHLISQDEEGGYRTLIAALTEKNPALRVVGLTATPFRLGHGYLHQGEHRLFHALIEPVSIEELIFAGHLAPLHSKVTAVKLSVNGVHRRGGEFIESELQAAVDQDPVTRSVVQDILSLAGARQHWLVFCAGVQHAYHVAEALRIAGVEAQTVTGETPATERSRLLAEFKAGKIRAITNANVLTTGFDYPDIDLLAMLRPTMSPGLYVQMAGRGMRVKSHTDHCLVLDFAGNVRRHGPITCVLPPDKAGEGNGEAPVKVCERCQEIVHLSLRACPVCGWEFPQKAKELELHDDDIMGMGGNEIEIDDWVWRRYRSLSSGKEMVKVTYYEHGVISGRDVSEYLCVLHDGYAGEKARATVAQIAAKARVDLHGIVGIDALIHEMNGGRRPNRIEVKKDGKYDRVTRRIWDEDGTED